MNFVNEIFLVVEMLIKKNLILIDYIVLGKFAFIDRKINTKL